MAQELLILSPEKTVLSFNLARIGSRIYAHLLDWLIIGVTVFISLILFVFIAGLAGAGGAAPTAITLAVYIVVLSLGPFAYFILLEGLWNGQTIGKKALGIRVRMVDGTPITFGAAIGRNFLRVGDFLPVGYFAGLMAMFTNSKSQRLGDMVANTIVLHEKKAEPRFTPAPYVLGVHPFENHVGELRGMNAEQYTTLKRLCDRFPELPANIQNKLIQEVWIPFATRFKIPPIENVHPVYLAEAVVMKYGRSHGLL